MPVAIMHLFQVYTVLKDRLLLTTKFWVFQLLMLWSSERWKVKLNPGPIIGCQHKILWLETLYIN